MYNRNLMLLNCQLCTSIRELSIIIDVVSAISSAHKCTSVNLTTPIAAYVYQTMRSGHVHQVEPLLNAI